MSNGIDQDLGGCFEASLKVRNNLVRISYVVETNSNGQLEIAMLKIPTKGEAEIRARVQIVTPP